MGSIKDYATGPDAPREWRKIVDRVDAGEFTWDDVQEGRMIADEELLNALRATEVSAQETGDGDVAKVNPVDESQPTGTHTGWGRRPPGIDDDDLPDVFFGPPS